MAHQPDSEVPGSLFSGQIKRSTFLRGVAAGVGGLALAGCGFGKSASQASSNSKSSAPIIIGASLPLTGSGAADGLGFSRGIELAIEEINAKGGIAGRQLKSEILDAKAFSPDVMVNNFKRLVTQLNADVIVGGYQLTSGPDLDIVADAGALYIHGNTKEKDATKVRSNPDRYWGVFQHAPTEVWYGKSLPGFLTRLEEASNWKPRDHTIAVLRGNDQYTTGISKALQEEIVKSSWKIGLVEQINIPTSEWGPVLAKLRQNPVDAIWVTDFLAADEASFMKQFAQQPMQSLVHMQYGPSNPEFRKLAGTAGDGITWATTVPLLQDDIGTGFADRFTKKFNATVSGTAAVTYDAVNIYAKAAAAAGGVGDKKAIAAAIKKTPFRGVCGARDFSFDPDQTARPYPAYTKDDTRGTPTGYFQIQNGENVLVDPSPFETAKFVMPSWMKA